MKRTGKRKVDGKPAVYYYAVYYLGKRQKWEKAPYPGRKQDADRLLRQRLREIDQGEYREVRKTTFAEFGAGWVRDYVEDPNHVKRSTAGAYYSIFERRLLPFFGEYPLTAITAEKVQEFTSGLSREGLSPKTICNYLSHRARCSTLPCAWSISKRARWERFKNRGYAGEKRLSFWLWKYAGNWR